MGGFRRVFEEEKQISYWPGWSSPEEETGYIWFDAPLDIGGVTEAGLVLHGGTYANVPNQNLTFELIVRNLRGKRRIAVARVDWRSLRGGHTNPAGGPSELSRKRMPDTHLHDFEPNYVAAEDRMRRRLPFAQPIEPQPQTFEEVREFVRKHFRINNIELVEPPNWEYNLFYNER